MTSSDRLSEYEDRLLTAGFRLNDAPAAVQVFALVDTVQAIVDNGGFGYLFEHPLDDDPGYAKALAAFGTIGAARSHDILAEVLSQFSHEELLNTEWRSRRWAEILKRDPQKVKNWESAFFEESGRTFELLADFADAQKL